MTIAWTTLLVVLLLLPGAFFFLGLYSRDRFTRELGRGNTITEFAVIVFVSAVVHLAAIFLLLWLRTRGLSLTDETAVARLLFESGSPDNIAAAVRTIESLLPFIAAYVLVTVAAGFFLGRTLAWFVLRGYLRFLARHKWIQEI